MSDASKLKDWAAQGLITAEQAAKILDYQNSKPQSSWILNSFLILGALTICLGVISLVAANWENYPHALKLVTNFSILTVVAIIIFRSYTPEPTTKFNILLLTFIILCLASMGLIGQIFHITSPWYQTALVWAGISFIAVITTQSYITWLIWLGALIWGVLGYLNIGIFDANPHKLEIFISTTFFLVFSLFISQKYTRNTGLSKGIFSWLIFLTPATILWTDFDSRYTFIPHQSTIYPGILPTLMLAIYAIFYASDLKKIQKILISSTLATIILALIIRDINLHNITFFALFGRSANALLSIVAFALIAVLMGSLRKQYLFYLFIFLIFLRILSYYFEAFGSLATTGLGLLFAGVLIIGLVILWKKNAKKLLAKIEGWTNAAS